MKNFLVRLLGIVVGWIGVGILFGISHMCITLFKFQMNVYEFAFTAFVASYYTREFSKSMKDLD